MPTATNSQPLPPAPDPLLPPRAWEREPFPGTEGLNATEIFGTPGYNAPRPRIPLIALVAAALGLASVIPGIGVVAVLTGLVGVRRLRYTYSSALSLSWFGVVTGTTSCVVYAWLWWLLTG